MDHESFADQQTMLTWQQSMNERPMLDRRARLLRDRLKALRTEIRQQENTVLKEQADFDQLAGKSLSVFVLTLSRQLDKKREKEQLEWIQAKRILDEKHQEESYLQSELTQIELKTMACQKAAAAWDQGMQDRISWIAGQSGSTVADRYRELTDQFNARQQHLIEVQQARRCAARALATTDEMITELGSAENWSTYDVWVSNGLISHLAKYDHIDKANACMYSLSTQLGDLRRELADVRLAGPESLNDYSSGTRAMDYFFDNIFTDLAVRDRVREDLATVQGIRSGIVKIERELGNQESQDQTQLSRFKSEIDQFLLTLVH